MGSAHAPKSILACLGLFAGLLLLGFAGVIVVYAPAASIAQEVHDAVASTRAHSRQLQQFGLVPTTTPLPSSWDSSDASSSSDYSSEPSKSSDWSSYSSSGTNTGAISFGYSLLVGWFGWVGALLLMLIFALLYHERVVEPVLHAKGTLKRAFVFRNHADDFHYNILECFADQWTCIHGLCCPVVRMAHTNAVSGLMGFWQSACTYCLCESLCCGRCLMVYWRMRLKEIMNIEDNCIHDFLVTFCCPNLSICQQASAVDHEFMYEVTDCCNLDWYDEEMNLQGTEMAYSG